MRLFLLALLAVGLNACALLPGPRPADSRSVFLLQPDNPSRPPTVATGCLTVVVNPPIAAPAHRGAQMLYQRFPNQIERFAYASWAATPAAMLEPLLLDALRADSRTGTVLAAPASVSADLRIENDRLWLVQVFENESSHVELTMQTRVLQPARRSLIGMREFHYEEPADAANPVEGVAAANRAVQRLLSDFGAWVGDLAESLDDHCEEKD